MKGLIGRLVVIFSILITVAGVFLLLNRPTGVNVNCDGEVSGFGSPGYPLTSFESGCRAEVQVLYESQAVCTGERSVIGESGVVSCNGLDRYRGENLSVSAQFYRDNELYANSTGNFYNRR